MCPFCPSTCWHLRGEYSTVQLSAMQLALPCSNKLIITPVARSQVLVVQGSAVTWSTLLTTSLRSLWPGTLASSP